MDSVTICCALPHKHLLFSGTRVIGAHISCVIVYPILSCVEYLPQLLEFCAHDGGFETPDNQSTTEPAFCSSFHSDWLEGASYFRQGPFGS